MSRFKYDAGVERRAAENGRQRQGVRVLMFEGERLSIAQIAERTGKTVKAVQGRVAKLRKEGVRELKREHFQ